MASSSPLLLALCCALSAPLAAQEQGGTVVFPGARVLAKAPVMGAAWVPGQFAMALVRGRTCLGVALDAGPKGAAPVLILLKGITALKVDRRTNSDVRIAVALPPAADSDWTSVDLVALGRQDAACTSPAPAGAP